MGLPAGEIWVSVNLPGGSDTDDVVALVNLAGSNDWWDFDDSSWKSSAWVDNDLLLTVVAGITLTEGGGGDAPVYAYGVIAGLTSGDVVTVHVKNITTGVTYFYGYFVVA